MVNRNRYDGVQHNVTLDTPQKRPVLMKKRHVNMNKRIANDGCGQLDTGTME